MAASLRTSRLLLRPWRDGDIAAYGQLEADPAVMEYLLPRPDWAARARAHWEEHGFGQWVVEIPPRPALSGWLVSTPSPTRHISPQQSSWPGGSRGPIGARVTPPRLLGRRS